MVAGTPFVSHWFDSQPSELGNPKLYPWVHYVRYIRQMEPQQLEEVGDVGFTPGRQQRLCSLHSFEITDVVVVILATLYVITF